MEFEDGSTIENDGRAFAGETAVDVYRIQVLIGMLEMEIKFPGMKMSGNMTALKGAQNVSGLTFGRGVSGRKKALEWAQNRMQELLATKKQDYCKWVCNDCGLEDNYQTEEELTICSTTAIQHAEEFTHDVSVFTREV